MLAHRGVSPTRSSAFAYASLPILIVVAGVFGLSPARAVLPAANADVRPAPVDSRLAKLLRDADVADSAGDLKVALIHLKQAALLSPQSGDIHARLGMMLLRTGDPVAAERELRRARLYKASDDLVVPPLLGAMLLRGENSQLLAEFPDPGDAPNRLAPDILRARAMALQNLARPAEADKAMERSLVLRRDALGLATRAKLASQQNDLAYAIRLADEASKLTPDSEDTLIIRVLVLRQQGQDQKALAVVSDFAARNPKSVVARGLRADIFLALNQPAKAKEDADWILAQDRDRTIGTYYHALVTARIQGAKAGWREAAVLPPDFVQSNPGMALTLAQLASEAGSHDSATAILAAVVQRHPEITQARIGLAELRLSENDPALALQALQPLSGSADPRVPAIIAQADLKLGRYAEAIPMLERATASGSIERADILKRQLAQSELQTGSAGAAIDELRQLAAQNPANVDTALQLATTLAISGKTEQALAETDRIAKQLPTNPLPPFYRGQILFAQGKLAAAADAFTAAAAVDPKFLPAFYGRANTEISRGNPDEAVSDLKTVIAKDPHNIPAYLQLANIALNNSRDADVVSILDTAIKAVPKNPEPQLALVRFEMSRRQYKDALARLDDVLRISPDNRDAMTLQGEILFATGAKTEAVARFRALVTKYPNLPDVQIAWARALNQVNDRIDAENAIAKAVELAPETAQYRSALVAAQFEHGKPEDALLSARTYRDLHPGPEADLLLAGTFVLLKREAEAESLLQTSFVAHRDPKIALALSRLELQLGKGKRAAEVLAESLRTNAGDFALRRQYALVLMQTGDHAGARREFETLLTQRPEDAIVLDSLGQLIQKDDPARAISLVSLGARVAPLSAPVIGHLGWMKLQRHDNVGALALLDRAHAIDANNPEIGYHYAVALDATGKREAAKTLLKAVLERSPGFEDAADARQLVARW